MPDLTGPISTLPGSGYSDDDCRIVPCQACGTEGRIYVADGYDRATGAPQERDGGPCPYCEGTGGEIIAVQPTTIEDLSADHERIWLQSAKDANSDTGRLWCEDKVWPDDIDVGEPTEYIRADLLAHMLEALKSAQAALSDGAFEGPLVDAALREIATAIAKASTRA